VKKFILQLYGQINGIKKIQSTGGVA